MRLLYQFENGFDVYFTTKNDGDAKDLKMRPVIEAELTNQTGKLVRLAGVHQIHSGIVHLIDCIQSTGLEAELADGDGLVSGNKALGLGVLVADCAPVALTSTEGIFAAVHAGWRGISEGVLPEAVRAMRSVGATDIFAYVGPSIRAECYEFKGPELRELSNELGPTVVARTSWNTVSLDLLESVKRSLSKVGITQVDASAECTACGEGYYSFRAKNSAERHLMVIVAGDSVR
ncbi:MAG: polyphenol oxidase family protein [Acidimicrobiaceae bacterium]|nr:polyphenol oxidase family protein [Acidimicrobiaceae bacterium]